MIPQKEFITIEDNLAQIQEFITEIIIQPKNTLKRWSSITNQTPAVKLGYIGQHMASLITGVKGTGSGARGDDLADGSEVKSCNKIDQVDKCKECDSRVMRYEERCPQCGGVDISRKDDSKWLFSVRSKEELDQYLEMQRIVLLLMDYPHFDDNNFKDIRISVFEIYPIEKRMSVFGQLIKNHYYNIYLPKINDNAKTNPMNLHPFGFQFYKCNPIKTFECVIEDIETSPKIKINKYLNPSVERGSSIKSEDMPTSLLKASELDSLIDKANFKKIKPLLKDNISKQELKKLSNKQKVEVLPFIDEELRNLIPLRPIVSVRQHSKYRRS